jgi:hypothetical protein
MDTPETLAAALVASGLKAAAGSRVAIQQSAQRIKTGARNNVRKSAPVHNAHAGDAITYDTSYGERFGSPVVEAEIGYDKARRGGSLGNLLEFGGGGDHSPPHRDLGRALDAEEPRFANAMERIAEKLL